LQTIGKETDKYVQDLFVREEQNRGTFQNNISQQVSYMQASITALEECIQREGQARETLSADVWEAMDSHTHDFTQNHVEAEVESSAKVAMASQRVYASPTLSPVPLQPMQMVSMGPPQTYTGVPAPQTRTALKTTVPALKIASATLRAVSPVPSVPTVSMHSPAIPIPCMSGSFRAPPTTAMTSSLSPRTPGPQVAPAVFAPPPVPCPQMEPITQVPSVYASAPTQQASQPGSVSLEAAQASAQQKTRMSLHVSEEHRESSHAHYHLNHGHGHGDSHSSSGGR